MKVEDIPHIDEQILEHIDEKMEAEHKGKPSLAKWKARR